MVADHPLDMRTGSLHRRKEAPTSFLLHSEGILHLSQHQDTWGPWGRGPLEGSHHGVPQDMRHFSEAALPEASIKLINIKTISL